MKFALPQGIWPKGRLPMRHVAAGRRIRASLARGGIGALSMRALGWFWGALLLLVAAGGGVLQVLGPPSRIATTPAGAPPAVAQAAMAVTKRAEPSVPPTAGLAVPAAAFLPGGIAPPDPALLEPSTVFEGGMLPRRGAGHAAPMLAYAAPFDTAAAGARPRVALLLSGIGMSETDSEEAIHRLPAAVSLAVSPYAFRPERLLADARATRHEVLLSIPMEPDGYPLDDAGNRALLTGNPPAVNDQRLEWALTRFAGYVGATGALSGMRGGRFAASPELIGPVLRELDRRGLIYVDPRPAAPALEGAAGRQVDVLIDDPAPVRAEIDANLARLEQIAKERGAALGLIGVPRPVTLDRVAAWAAGLEQRGLVLAPVSAIAMPPPPARPASTASEPAAGVAAK